ncbi:MAG: universal stress protein [Legionellales bacterium]
MYKKVLVPLDGSELAECALEHVKKLAKDGTLGEVVLLNVILIPLPPIGTDYNAGYIDFTALANYYLDESKKYLMAQQSKLSLEGITVKTESIEGANPASIIIDYTRQNGIDLIIMATHGYTGVKKMLLGSVANKVLQESHAPVLLIRPEVARK